MYQRNEADVTERGPYKMRTIVRLTDFSPALLRAWERRHGLLRPERGPGGHRMYTEEDLKILLRVRELIRQGRSIGEIASVGRDVLLGQAEDTRPPPALAQPVLRAMEPPPEEVKDQMSRWRRAIVEASLAMDSGGINRALDEAFSVVSAETAIFGVIEPTARDIGDLWMAGRCSVASEHLASGIFVHKLRKLVEAAEPSRSDWAPVIVACFPDEYHQLGALIVAHQLCRNGLRVSFLGAALPFEDLEGACEVIGPAAVLLSVTRDAVFQIHRRGLVETLRLRSNETAFYVGGQGVPAVDSQLEKSGVRLVTAKQDIQTVLEEIVNGVRRQRRRLLQ
jgi:MerR family transcriptional regulator, light-induced transcriptional regulator